jgi:cytochrome c-type biogenesis protein CcmE
MHRKIQKKYKKKLFKIICLLNHLALMNKMILMKSKKSIKILMNNKIHLFQKNQGHYQNKKF